MDILSDMLATSRMVDWTLLEDSADFALIKHMFMSSIVSHRMALGSCDWAEKMQLDIVSITLVPVSAKFRTKYLARCEWFHQKELAEPMFPNEVWRPVASKDANEVFLFHGTHWDNVGGISSEGFDWKRCSVGMFGRGAYFAPN
eukprot:2018881-Amphidinium_carterae.1